MSRRNFGYCAVSSLIEQATKPETAMSIECFNSRLYISESTMRVFADGELVDLSKGEYDILHYLAYQRGVICSRQDIKEKGLKDGSVSDNSLNVRISNLRQKLGGDFADSKKGVILKLYGQGYKLNMYPHTSLSTER